MAVFPVLQVLTVRMVLSLAVNAVPDADRISMWELVGIVNIIVVAPTSIDSTTALVPTTVMSELFTLNIVSVVSVTSLYAANAREGARSAIVAAEAKIF